MNRKALVLAGAMALLAAGCSTPRGGGSAPVSEPAVTMAEPEVKTPVRPPAVNETEALLAYFEHARKLPAAEFSREIDAVRKLYSRVRSDVVRLRYGILLSAPAAGPGDDARALELLDPVLKSADAGLR